MNIELLAQIYGEISALYMLPLLHPHQTGWAAWQAAYKETGLPFADSRRTAESLRILVAAGLLTANGNTQGRGFRLTFKGALLASAWSGIFIKDCQRAARELQRAQAKTCDSLPATGWPIVMGFRLVPEAGEGWSKAYRDPQGYTLGMSKRVNRLMPLLVCGFAELIPSYGGTAFALHLHKLPDADQWRVAGAPTSDEQAGENWRACCTGFDAGIVRFTRPPPAAFSGVIGAMIPASLHR